MVALALAMAALVGSCQYAWGEPGREELTAAMLGDDWPLTVDHGMLVCDGDPAGGAVNSIIFIAPDGTEYAVNGSALLRGYPEIAPIWAMTDPPARHDLGPLHSRGLALCPAYRDLRDQRLPTPTSSAVPP